MFSFLRRLFNRTLQEQYDEIFFCEDSAERCYKLICYIENNFKNISFPREGYDERIFTNIVSLISTTHVIKSHINDASRINFELKQNTSLPATVSLRSYYYSSNGKNINLEKTTAVFLENSKLFLNSYLLTEGCDEQSFYDRTLMPIVIEIEKVLKDIALVNTENLNGKER